MSNRSEQLIILRLQSGDQQAFSDLYKQYSDPIFRFIHFRVSDRETAKDIMQEAFTRFIEVADKGHINNIKAYLYRIAKNLVIDFYKETGRQPTISLEQTSEIISIYGKESIEAKIDLEIIVRITQNLKPLWRDIVTFRIIDGLEYEEIAEVVGKSNNYIRVNLHRALKELNKLLENES